MLAEELDNFLQVSQQQGELVGWLREYAGFSPISPTIPECLAKFPLLDRERVDQAIRQVREEKKTQDPLAEASVGALTFILKAGRSAVGLKEFHSLPPDVRAEVRKLLPKDLPIEKSLKLIADTGVEVRFSPAVAKPSRRRKRKA